MNSRHFLTDRYHMTLATGEGGRCLKWTFSTNKFSSSAGRGEDHLEGGEEFTTVSPPLSSILNRPVVACREFLLVRLPNQPCRPLNGAVGHDKGRQGIHRFCAGCKSRRRMRMWARPLM